MSSLALIAGRRRFVPHPRLPERCAAVDPLVCLLVFSVTGLLGSCLVVLMLPSDPSANFLQVLLVGATAPVAALMGLVVGRRS